MTAYTRPFLHPDTLTTSNATAKSAASVELPSFQKRSVAFKFMVRPTTDANRRIHTEERPEDTRALCVICTWRDFHNFFTFLSVRMAICKFLLLFPSGRSPTAQAHTLFCEREHASDTTDYLADAEP